MRRIINTVFVFDDITIPVKIYREMRMDTRLSILSDKAIIRIPIFYNKSLFDKNISWAKQQLQNKLDNNQALQKRFTEKNYKSGDVLNINGKTFIIKIEKSTLKNFHARLIENTIYIKIPQGISLFDTNKNIKTLLSRITAQYFLPEITKRIQTINNKYFGFDINNIRLKYNKTNWGSRSAKNNINISTRLLFAPKEVQDYVFVHELAHFKEMNHSNRFWQIVHKIIPDYKEKEKWLKKHGHECDF